MKFCYICNKEKEDNDFAKKRRRTCYDCEDYRKCNCCKEVKKIEKFENNRNLCRKCKNKQIDNRRKIKGSRSNLRRLEYSREYQLKRYKKVVNKKMVDPEKYDVRKKRWQFSRCMQRLYKGTRKSYVLGFTRNELISKFPYKIEGYHFDHCIPLSWFKETTPLSISCSLSNLRYVPSSENIKKSNLYFDVPDNPNFIRDNISYIKEKYMKHFENYILTNL